jgi:hypothetical protein
MIEIEILRFFGYSTDYAGCRCRVTIRAPRGVLLCPSLCPQPHQHLFHLYTEPDRISSLLPHPTAAETRRTRISHDFIWVRVVQIRTHMPKVSLTKPRSIDLHAALPPTSSFLRLLAPNPHSPCLEDIQDSDLDLNPLVRRPAGSPPQLSMRHQPPPLYPSIFQSSFLSSPSHPLIYTW